jgi:uncharacterized membrane protein
MHAQDRLTSAAAECASDSMGTASCSRRIACARHAQQQAGAQLYVRGPSCRRCSAPDGRGGARGIPAPAGQLIEAPWVPSHH